MSDRNIPQSGSLEPTSATPCTRLTPHQVALITAQQAVNYILYGEPLPQTFNRSDLKTAAVELGKIPAELEVLQ